MITITIIADLNVIFEIIAFKPYVVPVTNIRYDSNLYGSDLTLIGSIDSNLARVKNGRHLKVVIIDGSMIERWSPF